MEPMFSRRRDLQGLTPKVTIKVKDRSLSLLEDLAHRAADAVIRCSDKGKIIRKAFLAYRDERNAVPLAKIAPTSLVFGAWDSRGDADDPRPTNVKLPRIVESTIRAYGADQLRRGATYVAALTEEERQEFALSGNSEEGFANALSQSPGGIIATNGIRREATLSFTPIRALGAPDHQSTESLQRYIFGLALVAFVATPESHLRQGCVLVASSQQPAKKQVVWRNGNREPFLVTENDAIAFAKAAADAFVVGPEVEAIFNPQSAKSARKSAGK
jgi:CRISPR-associated protein Csb1